MSIILLRGFSNSGKDYIGNILCDKYGYVRVAFADSLKYIIADTFNCDIQLLHSQTGKLTICESDTMKRTYRQILIDEAFRLRYIDPDIFAKHCCKEMYSINQQDTPRNFVITDWRYPNELEIVKQYFPDYDIIPVHIRRNMQTVSPVNDKSEYNLIHRIDDYEIINNMDDSIYQEVNNLIVHMNTADRR